MVLHRLGVGVLLLLLEASPTSAAACCCAPPTRSARVPESCAGTKSPGSGATQSRRGEVSSCAEAFLPSCDRRVCCPADFEPRASQRRPPLADAPLTPRADMDDIHHPPHPTGQAPWLGDDDAKGGAAAGGRTRGLDSGEGSGGGGRPGIKPSSGRTRVRTRLHACAVWAGVCGCVLARRSIDRLPISANRAPPRTSRTTPTPTSYHDHSSRRQRGQWTSGTSCSRGPSACTAPARAWRWPASPSRPTTARSSSTGSCS